MKYDKVVEKVREKPLTAVSAVFLVFFWLLTPLVAQKYFNYSAITVSFSITVVYFVAWKLYEHRGRFFI